MVRNLPKDLKLYLLVGTMLSISKTAKVILTPKQLNDIHGSILEELQKTFEGTVSDKGLILNIDSLEKRSLGSRIEGALSGDLEFNVQFRAICYDCRKGDHLFGLRVRAVKDPAVFAEHPIYPFNCIIPSELGDYNEEYFNELATQGKTFNAEIRAISTNIGAETLTFIVRKLNRLEVPEWNRKVQIHSPIYYPDEFLPWVAPGEPIPMLGELGVAKLDFAKSLLASVPQDMLDMVQERGGYDKDLVVKEIEAEFKESFASFKKVSKGGNYALFWDDSKDIVGLVKLAIALQEELGKDTCAVVRLRLGYSTPFMKILYVIWGLFGICWLFKPKSSSPVVDEFFLVGLGRSERKWDVLKKLKVEGPVKDLLLDPSESLTALTEFVGVYEEFFLGCVQQMGNKVEEIKWLQGLPVDSSEFSKRLEVQAKK